MKVAQAVADSELDRRDGVLPRDRQLAAGPGDVDEGDRQLIQPGGDLRVHPHRHADDVELRVVVDGANQVGLVVGVELVPNHSAFKKRNHSI